MGKLKSTLYLSIFLIINQINSFSQTNEKNLGIWYDNIVGEENLNIFNGSYNYIRERTISDTINPYFSKDFIEGTVNYSEQLYDSVLMKYNSNTDNLVIKPKKLDNFYSLILNSEKVKGFILDNKHFINASKNEVLSKNNFKGFFEEIKDKNFTIYIKHYKSKSDKIYDKRVFVTFQKNETYYLYLEDKINEIKSEKDLIEIFPNLKKEINNFKNDNKIAKKYNFHAYMLKLFSFVNDTIN